MVKRIYNAVLCVAFSVLLISFIIIMGVLYTYFDQQYVDELQKEASFICQGVESQGIDYLNKINSGDTRITWIDPSGAVLYDNGADVSQMDNHADREEVEEALESDTGKSIRYSSTLSEKNIYYATRLSDGTVLRVSGAQFSVLMLVIGMIQPLAIVMLIALLISIYLAYRVSGSIVKPLNQIDLEHPEAFDTYDELAPFLRRISKQNRQIEQQIQELKKQREEFSAITENMNEGFLVIDTKTMVLSYNSSALRQLNVHTVAENKSVLELNRSESFCKAVDLALSGRNNEQVMFFQEKYFQLFANPVYQDNQVVGAVIILMDITEKEQREILRREFTANVSHELKTPLTSISGFAEIIKNGIVRSEDVPRFAENIYRESQRLIHLVSDIIRLSKLDEQGMEAERETVDLGKLVDYAVSAVRPEAEKRDILLSVEKEECRLVGIRAILEEIFFNLCDNAVKYNKDHGEVRIKLYQENNNIVFSIEDTGIGIPFADRDRVFERFYRVDKSHSKAIGGTGLGLSIVKHGVAIHHGEISMESHIDQGTRMVIRFPIESDNR